MFGGKAADEFLGDGDDGLNLERVAHDDGASGAPERAQRALRCGLSCLIDDDKAEGARRHIFQECLHRGEGGGQNRDNEQESVEQVTISRLAVSGFQPAAQRAKSRIRFCLTRLLDRTKALCSMSA